MDDRELALLFRKELDEMGFCSKFQELWREDFTRTELIDLYRRGIEYCIEHDWPSVEFIKNHFSRDMLRKGRVYVDDDFGFVAGESGVYVFNGTSNGTVDFERFDTATIYVRHNSNVVINAGGLSRVFVEVYDNSSVTINQKDVAVAFVYMRSENATLKTDGNVRIRR